MTCRCGSPYPGAHKWGCRELRGQGFQSPEVDYESIIEAREVNRAARRLVDFDVTGPDPSPEGRVEP